MKDTGTCLCQGVLEVNYIALSSIIDIKKYTSLLMTSQNPWHTGKEKEGV